MYRVDAQMDLTLTNYAHLFGQYTGLGPYCGWDACYDLFPTPVCSCEGHLVGQRYLRPGDAALGSWDSLTVTGTCGSLEMTLGAQP